MGKLNAKIDNEIIRIQKKKNNFVMLDKGFLEDNHLSFKAKGILAYLLSKPDDWKVIIKDLINHSSDGKGSIYNGLNELKKYGYYKKEPVRDEKGVILRWESVIYECPDCENDKINPITPPLPNFPDMDNPFVENGEHNNTNSNKTNLSNNIINQSEPEPETNDTIDKIKYTVEKNISLNILLHNYPSKQTEIKELYQLIVEALISNKRTFRIAKENLPSAVVKDAFRNLHSGHIEYVLTCLQSNTTEVKNIKPYLLTALFNSTATIGNYYSLAVQHDLSEKLPLL